MESEQRHENWMLIERGPGRREAPEVRYAGRFESLGLRLPERRLTTSELLASARHHTHIDLERLTGIRERRVVESGEDSFTLALDAARDCLAHSAYGARDIQMLINCSISKNRGGLRHELEPTFAVRLRKALGATNARVFDVSNACAGMLTGVFILNDYIRRGVTERGMVVSGESISNLGENAAYEIRSIMSRQLASLTLGDAGVAAIVDRAPSGAPGFAVLAFTTLSDHSRLCIGVPAKVGPGGQMYTRAREIHRVAIEDSPLLLKEALDESGLSFGSIDWVIPHQTSARAIEKGTEEIAQRLGVRPKNVVVNVGERGNTASTTHFVALYDYLRARRFNGGDKIMLISFASGLEVGVLIFEMDELMERYGNDH
jgi:3-oxoacyl-[acyl-carrier-protein] synthase-3